MSMTAVIGGTERFFRFITSTGASAVREGSVRQALEDPECDSVMILPEYDKGIEKVPQMTLADIEVLAKKKRGGLRVYAENYDAYNFYQCSVFGYETAGEICHVSTETLYAQQGFQVKLGGDRILQAFGASFLPATVKHIDPYVREKSEWILMGDFAGTSRPAQEPEPLAQAVLVRSGSVISALCSFSRFDEANMRPNCRWKKLYAALYSKILNVPEKNIERAFEKVFPHVGTA